MLTKVKKSHKSDVRFLFTFDVRTSKAYGEHVSDFRGSLAVQGRSNVSILIENSHDVDGDLNDNIWTDITVWRRCMHQVPLTWGSIFEAMYMSELSICYTTTIHLYPYDTSSIYWVGLLEITTS